MSAGDAYLRAGNYFRAAEFYLHGKPDDPRIAELSGRGARCFREGLRASSPSAWLTMLLDYNLAACAAAIRCPTLVVDVEHEESFPGEAKKLYDALTCAKTWMFFSEEEGAGDHSQTGSPTLAQQRILDWLDETVR